LFNDESVAFSSAGTHAIADDPATDTMQLMADDFDLDLSEHRATLLGDCDRPDLVLGMEQHHLVAARHQFPELDASQIRLLDHPNAVVDPYGRDVETYRGTAAHVMRVLKATDLESFTSAPRSRP
jgi:protein-tyrosine-phosphatase